MKSITPYSVEHVSYLTSYQDHRCFFCYERLIEDGLLKYKVGLYNQLGEDKLTNIILHCEECFGNREKMSENTFKQYARTKAGAHYDVELPRIWQAVFGWWERQDFGFDND